MQTIIKEIHSGELTNNCLRAVQLKHEGKVIGQAPGALFFGSLVHEAFRLIHVNKWWAMSGISVVAHAKSNVVKTLEAERRPLTQAVIDGMKETLAEADEMVELYQARFRDYFAKCKFIGCEVPIRATFEVDGEPVEFASHIDLMFRCPSESLTWWDWKSQEEAPTLDFLNRNMQMGMYHVALMSGEVLLDGEWVSFGGEPPHGAWVHVKYLYPYSKKTQAMNDLGEMQDFVKGDLRPTKNIVREIMPTNETSILEEFALRTRMMRSGHFPTSPTPIGCRICESRKWCPSWWTDDKSEGANS